MLCRGVSLPDSGEEEGWWMSYFLH